MNETINNDAKIDLNCTQCGSLMQKTIRELKTNDIFICSKCGQKFKPKNFDKSMDEAERMIQDFCKKASKTFTIKF